MGPQGAQRSQRDPWKLLGEATAEVEPMECTTSPEQRKIYRSCGKVLWDLEKDGRMERAELETDSSS